MLRPASQHRSCARSGDRDGSWGSSQAVRHHAVAVAVVDGGHGPQQHEGCGVGAQAGQYNAGATGAEAAARLGTGRRREAIMRGGEIGTVRNIAMDELMIGRAGMTVSVRMIVTAARRRRAQVMVGAQRTIRHKGKRRRDRQTGREASAEQMDESNHPRTDSCYVSEILFVDFMPVQSGQRYKSTRTTQIWWHSVK